VGGNARCMAAIRPLYRDVTTSPCQGADAENVSERIESIHRVPYERGMEDVIIAQMFFDV